MVSPHHCRRVTLGIARLSIAAHGVGSQRRHMYARRRRRCRRRSRYAPLAPSFCRTHLSQHALLLLSHLSLSAPLSLSLYAHSHRRSCVRICNRATPRSRMAICAQHGRRQRTRSFLARSTNSVQSGLRSRGGCQGGRSTPHGIAIIGSSRAARRTILHERESRE